MTQQQTQQAQQGAAAEQGAGTEAEGGDALKQLETALGEEGAAAGEEKPAEWTPPTKAEHDATLAALEAERGKLKRAREQAKRLRESTKAVAGAIEAEAGGAPAAGAGSEAAPDPRIAAMQTRVVRAAAKARLLEDGADPELVDLALARLQPDQVEFTEDDEPDLDEWLDEMKDKHPKVFAKPTAEQGGARRALGGVDQGRGAGAGTVKKLTFGQQVIENAKRAQGRGRR